MIFLSQNTINPVYLTLSESVTLTATNVYFLFKFIDETTHSQLLFTAPDLSTNTLRYNLFNITLSGSAYQNLTAGTISLNPDGKYKYEVYEMTGQTNLLVSGTTGTIIEQGIVTVSGTNISDISYEYDGLSGQTFYYWQPTI